ncbi:oxidoreductase family, NAD-binding Rossmann fold protein [Aspergillus steynii IBT 23096]|uniref:Oxidoreductase family, NAD-binding Rossmann fold protein n=1 Tax=Aspergillus steynii IBT 23096 TaxID=1392250 RepID=A0A2I2GL47_9EURO|nr:oxidoreductase family, NAD-binding Rossmann fold protein [Aspergillus steynii IBT 23096]PLB53608.1 oxidoreductase family, NAD-binding Rossmann fold protein [Aspergillus steynii IBT 23096]
MAFGVALIGAAHPSIKASPDLELKAVYSRSLETAQKVAPDQPLDRYAEDADQGLQQLLARPDIHGVIIALAIGVQTPYIRAALSAGKHVLSEKPITENVAEAVELIRWYRSEISQTVSWAVAENWRYLDSLIYARQLVPQLGRLSQFRTLVYANIGPEWGLAQYYQTAWRQEAMHQGGYLLDVGIHFLAGTRYLLGNESISRVTAFTRGVRPSLPPLDTLDAVLQTESGLQGSVQIALSSSLKDSGWTVVGEHGHIVVTEVSVTSIIRGREEIKEFKADALAVPSEVRAWGEALTRGTPNAEQTPEQGLADLELVEVMLRSAAQQGQPQSTKHQVEG